MGGSRYAIDGGMVKVARGKFVVAETQNSSR